MFLSDTCGLLDDLTTYKDSPVSVYGGNHSYTCDKILITMNLIYQYSGIIIIMKFVQLKCIIHWYSSSTGRCLEFHES